MSLVNNAGITTIGDVEALMIDTWRKTLAVNLVFVGTQAAIGMKSQGSAAILNTGNHERSRIATSFKTLSLDIKD